MSQSRKTPRSANVAPLYAAQPQRSPARRRPGALLMGTALSSIMVITPLTSALAQTTKIDLEQPLPQADSTFDSVETPSGDIDIAAGETLEITDTGVVFIDDDDDDYIKFNNGSTLINRGQILHDYIHDFDEYGPIVFAEDDVKDITFYNYGYVAADIDTVDFTGAENAHILNYGTIINLNDSEDDALNIDDMNDVWVVNKGLIQSNDSDAIDLDKSVDVTIENSGRIISRVNEAIEADDAENFILENSGSIEAKYDVVSLDGVAGSRILNTSDGVISASSGDDALVLEGSADVRIENSGNITASDDRVIGAGGATNANISNSGTIAAADADGIAADDFAGIEADDTVDFHLVNSGTIKAGSDGAVKADSASDAVIINSSIIEAAKDTITANNVSGSFTLTNEGRLRAESDTVIITGDGKISIQNTGLIESTDLNATAISVGNTDIAGNSIVVALSEGSRVIGGLDVADGTSNATLQFDVGSSMSYVYETSGAWQLQDLDDRAVVKGSAMAAGIGNIEAADEFMFDRSRSLRFSMDRLTRQSNRQKGGVFDSYGSYSSRDEEGTLPSLEMDSYGFTAGSRLRLFDTDAIAFFNFHATDANIGYTDHRISSESWRIGLSAPKIFETNGWSIGGYSVAGYNSYEGNRDVLVNQNTNTGLAEIKADWDSTELEVGANALHKQDLTSKLSVHSSFGLSVQAETVGAYSEEQYFAWDGRTVIIGHGTLNVGLEYAATEQTQLYGEVGTWSRDTLSGSSASYQINGTDVSYEGGDYQETTASLRLGVRQKLSQNAALAAEVVGMTSDKTEENWGLSLGIQASF